MSKEREDAMDAASWYTLWKFVQQAHPQDKEEGVQEPSPHINKVMG